MKPQYLTINMKANKLYFQIFFQFFATVNFALQHYSLDENLDRDYSNKSYSNVLQSDTVYLPIFFKMKFGILV